MNFEKDIRDKMQNMEIVPSTKAWDSVRKKQSNSKKLLLIKKLSIAALLLLSIGIGFNLFNVDTKNKPIVNLDLKEIANIPTKENPLLLTRVNTDYTSFLEKEIDVLKGNKEKPRLKKEPIYINTIAVNEINLNRKSRLVLTQNIEEPLVISAEELLEIVEHPKKIKVLNYDVNIKAVTQEVNRLFKLNQKLKTVQAWASNQLKTTNYE